MTYEGRRYTMYEATQQQRKVERAIRRQKNRILVDEATGDKEKLLTDQIRLQRLNQEYARFSKATGLPTQRERATVARFGTKEALSAKKAAADQATWEAMKRAIGKNAPKSLEDFTHIKYTDSKEWGRLMENKRLFEKIDSTASYSVEYREKMKQTYQYFKDHGFVFREHALNRFLGQKSGKDKFFFTQEDLLSVLQGRANFRQLDGKLIRFYNGMAVITAPDTGEVVSIVVRCKAKTDWEAL